MKTLYTGLLLMAITALGFGQENQNKKLADTPDPDKAVCFDKKTHVINFGICAPVMNSYGSKSFNSLNLGNYSITGNSQAYNISYEQALPKRAGKGYLSVGGFFGFQNTYFKYNDYNGSDYYLYFNNNFYTMALRGSYHLDILNSKRAEVYFGAMAGLGINDMLVESNDPDLNIFGNRLHLIIPGRYTSIFAGARWYFVKNVALFGEMGFRSNYLTGGLSVKF